MADDIVKELAKRPGYRDYMRSEPTTSGLKEVAPEVFKYFGPKAALHRALYPAFEEKPKLSELNWRDIGRQLREGEDIGLEVDEPMIGTIPGVKRVFQAVQRGELTKKGTPIIQKVEKWFDPKYRGRLWEAPPGSQPEGGAYGRYYKFKGQAPGAGVKAGFTEGERRMLYTLAAEHGKTGEKAGMYLFNTDPVLRKYMPKMYTTPGQGRYFMSEAIDHLDWDDIRHLPIEEQRRLYINWYKGAKELAERMGELGFEIGDIGTKNVVMTRSGAPKILDLGIHHPAAAAQQPQHTAGSQLRSLVGLTRWNMVHGARPNFNSFEASEKAVELLNKGQLTDDMLKSSSFWEDLGGVPTTTPTNAEDIFRPLERVSSKRQVSPQPPGTSPTAAKSPLPSQPLFDPSDIRKALEAIPKWEDIRIMDKRNTTMADRSRWWSFKPLVRREIEKLVSATGRRKKIKKRLQVMANVIKKGKVPYIPENLNKFQQEELAARLARRLMAGYEEGTFDPARAMDIKGHPQWLKDTPTRYGIKIENPASPSQGVIQPRFMGNQELFQEMEAAKGFLRGGNLVQSDIEYWQNRLDDIMDELRSRGAASPTPLSTPPKVGLEIGERELARQELMGQQEFQELPIMEMSPGGTWREQIELPGLSSPAGRPPHMSKFDIIDEEVGRFRDVVKEYAGRKMRGLKKIADSLGIIYNGPQQGMGKIPDMHLFTDKVTGSTFSVLGEPTESNIKKAFEAFKKRAWR